MSHHSKTCLMLAFSVAGCSVSTTSELASTISTAPTEIIEAAEPLGLALSPYHAEGAQEDELRILIPDDVHAWFEERGCEIDLASGLVLEENAASRSFVDAQLNAVNIPRTFGNARAYRFSAACSEKERIHEEGPGQTEKEGELVVVESDRGLTTTVRILQFQAQNTYVRESATWQNLSATNEVGLAQIPNHRMSSSSASTQDAANEAELSPECLACADQGFRRALRVGTAVGAGLASTIVSASCAAVTGLVVGLFAAAVFPFGATIISTAAMITASLACGVGGSLLGGRIGYDWVDRYGIDRVLDQCVEDRRCTPEEANNYEGTLQSILTDEDTTDEEAVDDPTAD